MTNKSDAKATKWFVAIKIPVSGKIQIFEFDSPIEAVECANTSKELGFEVLMGWGD